MYCIVTVVRFVIILIKFYVCMYVCILSICASHLSVTFLLFLGYGSPLAILAQPHVYVKVPVFY